MKKYRTLNECYRSIYEQLSPATQIATDPNLGDATGASSDMSQAMGQLTASIKSLPKPQEDVMLTQILGAVMEGSSEKLVQALASISKMGSQMASIAALQPQNLQQTLNRMFANRPNVADTMKTAQQPDQSMTSTMQNSKPPTAQSLNIMGS